MRRRQAFTLVEVMVSLGVMTIAALAIFAMQQQLIRANAHARQLTIATQIAQNWIERLKMDALRWNAAGPPSNTRYLKAILAPDADPAGFIPIPLDIVTNGTEKRVVSHAFDWFGNDLDTTGGAPAGLVYCASHRLNWVFDNMRVIRADVRVWWPRDGIGASIGAEYPECKDDNEKLNPKGDNFDRYHVVYLSTVLRAAP
ncbi:MAG TPA: prepilin-type N-terminal cleavage/methylation domain-containing protein [Polyangiales bacterium]|nr:prepilin-type N-terminal cleavage/methylation domain-containing protein [Polyangiales bacterium]